MHVCLSVCRSVCLSITLLGAISHGVSFKSHEIVKKSPFEKKKDFPVFATLAKFRPTGGAKWLQLVISDRYLEYWSLIYFTYGVDTRQVSLQNMNRWLATLAKLTTLTKSVVLEYYLDYSWPNTIHMSCIHWLGEAAEIFRFLATFMASQWGHKLPSLTRCNL